MGKVIEVGREVKNLKVGDRAVVPFTIACGSCFFCEKELPLPCQTSALIFQFPWLMIG